MIGPRSRLGVDPGPLELAALRAAVARGAGRLVVEGRSMAPVLLPGDEVLIDAHAPTIGELAVILLRGRLVVHRVVAVDEGRLVTRGDANDAADPPVERAAVVGRVARIEPGFGRRRLRRLLLRGRSLARDAGVSVAWGALQGPARLRALLSAGADAAVLGLLDEEQLDRLTAIDYARSHYADGDWISIGLFPWEHEALARHFPPGGRWLVTSAGGGREAVALATGGREVVATECVPHLAVELGARLRPPHSALHIEPDSIPEGAFDAAIVGWGAYSHLPSRTRRVAFVRRLVGALRPGAPLLVSYLDRPPRLPRGDLRVLAVADRIRRMRGRPPTEPGSTVGRGRFQRAFAPGEVPDELAEAGLLVELETNVGHAHTIARKPREAA